MQDYYSAARFWRLFGTRFQESVFDPFLNSMIGAQTHPFDYHLQCSIVGIRLGYGCCRTKVFVASHGTPLPSHLWCSSRPWLRYSCGFSSLRPQCQSQRPKNNFYHKCYEYHSNFFSVAKKRKHGIKKTWGSNSHVSPENIKQLRKIDCAEFPPIYSKGIICGHLLSRIHRRLFHCFSIQEIF